MLRQFDAGATAPSIRQLATALDVAPSAIYHHFPSRAAIYQAGVDLVWTEASRDVLELVPDPWAAAPQETLVAAGIASRARSCGHYQIAPRTPGRTPAGEGMMANVIALVASLLERIGLERRGGRGAFHTYATFTFGTIIFAATRQIAHDELGGGAGDGSFSSAPGEREASRSSAATRSAIDGVIDLSAIDPARDEQLFADGTAAAGRRLRARGAGTSDACATTYRSGRLRAARARLLRARARRSGDRLHLHRRRETRPARRTSRDHVLLGDDPARAQSYGGGAFAPHVALHARRSGCGRATSSAGWRCGARPSTSCSPASAPSWRRPTPLRVAGAFQRRLAALAVAVRRSGGLDAVEQPAGGLLTIAGVAPRGLW